MNHVVLSGRLVDKVELRQSKSGKPYCTFSMAVRNPRDGKQVDFFDCIAGGQTAEFLATYGKKGDAFEVCGAITFREYTDKNNVKRRKAEILLDKAFFALTRVNTPGHEDLDLDFD